MDLVVVSLEAWDTIWRRNQHLVSRLLKTNPSLRVLFVEPAADPLYDLFSRRRPSRGQGVTTIPGYDGRLLRFRPVKRLPRRLDRRTDARLANTIVRAAHRAGMRRPTLWLNDPGAAPLARLTAWPTLYDMTDDWLAADRPAAELERIRKEEGWLLVHAAAVVACSAELVRRKSPDRQGRAIDLVANAVDVDAYREPKQRPADLPAAAAVYVGTLHTDRLDVALCVATARALAGRGSLVLVGPNALSAADTDRLRAAGVVLLGPRDYDAVIGYLQHADALVVPHVISAFTDSLDPIKMYEYAAVGRPVFATAVAGFRDADDPRVTVAEASDFPAIVASAVPAPSASLDGTAAPVPTWEDRATAMESVLDAIGPR